MWSNPLSGSEGRQVWWQHWRRRRRRSPIITTTSRRLHLVHLLPATRPSCPFITVLQRAVVVLWPVREGWATQAAEVTRRTSVIGTRTPSHLVTTVRSATVWWRLFTHINNLLGSTPLLWSPSTLYILSSALTVLTYPYTIALFRDQYTWHFCGFTVV